VPCLVAFCLVFPEKNQTCPSTVALKPDEHVLA